MRKYLKRTPRRSTTDIAKWSLIEAFEYEDQYITAPVPEESSTNNT